jgi:two-component system, OmpR family, alkaline phosphatase synthesis response regulator PhoP
VKSLREAQVKKRILVIEDNQDLANLVVMHLRDLSYEVEAAADGAEGLAMAESGSFNLIILDLMLPGVDGLEICRRLRGRPPYMPILMLTAKSSELDRVLGLEMGADDYLSKPFSITELLARVKAIFRRIEQIELGRHNIETETIRTGELVIEVEKRGVMLRGQRVDLTAREFDLLLHFARHPGRVFTRMQLLDSLWGYSHEGYDHTVNSHINRLRAKIEDDPAHPRYILTVWGVGYKFSGSLERTEAQNV